MIDTLIVLAKQPESGRVKTRLVPPLSHEQAAMVATAALTDTLRVVDWTAARQRLLAFDARPGRWLPIGWQSCRQPAGSLDVRIAAAFRAAGRGPALLVGMDTPQVCSDHLQTFDPERYDACLGPASDGGYWAIGLREPHRAAEAVVGVPMSTCHTGEDQLRSLHDLGLRVQLLEELTDVDSFDDACQVAALVPKSTFGGVVSTLHTALLDSVR